MSSSEHLVHSVQNGTVQAVLGCAVDVCCLVTNLVMVSVA